MVTYYGEGGGGGGLRNGRGGGASVASTTNKGGGGGCHSFERGRGAQQVLPCLEGKGAQKVSGP